MSLLRNLLQSMKEQQQKREDIDDEQTKDLYLRSLRRQRRIQLEEKEKVLLKKRIKEHELQRTREVVLGTVSKEKIKLIKTKIQKKKGKIGFLNRGSL